MSKYRDVASTERAMAFSTRHAKRDEQPLKQPAVITQREDKRGNPL
jgi:hypothetical protein